MTAQLIVSAAIASFSILKIYCYLKAKNRVLVLFDFFITSASFFLFFQADSSTARLIYEFIYPVLFCSLIYMTFSEPLFCKLYNAGVQCVVTFASVYMADNIFIKYSWQWASAIIAMHAAWFLIMYRMRIKKFVSIPLSEISYKKSIFVCIIVYLFLVYCASGGESILSRWTQNSLPAAASLFSLGIVVVLIDGFLHITDSMTQQQNLAVISRQNRIMKKYIENLERYRNRISIMEHDYVHFEERLAELIHGGRSDLALEMLKRAASSTRSKRRYSDDSLLNALLEDTAQRCTGIKTAYECVVRLPEKIEIDDTDMTSIIMNISDNAVECCRRLEQTAEPYINISIYISGGFLIIKSKNSVDKAPSIVGNTISSTKEEDGIPHGLGLESIRIASRKYCGKVLLEGEESFFQISVVLENRKPDSGIN